MKECILEVSFEGQGWSSRLYIILFILTLELRYPQKIGVNRKTGGNFVSSSAWEGENHLTWERKDLPGRPGLGESYKLNYKMNFVQDSCQRFLLHFFKGTFH